MRAPVMTGDAAGQVGGLVTLRPVEIGTLGAHRVVEEVDAAELGLQT
jgi:hypothetical protein